jgi:tRNA A-37 threonylcarbamoyl transferase component Bud32
MESIPTSAINLDEKERDFYQKLALLPKELAQVWLFNYEDLDSDAGAFFNEFDVFFKKRQEALSGTLEINTDVDEEIRNEILSVHAAIKSTFGDSNYFLGNGRTAEVYTLPIAPHLCVKYIKDQDAYNENNHMRVEYDFLDTLHAFHTENVRTPHPYFIRIHPSEGHSYGMEKINGENLSRILEFQSKNVDLIAMLKEVDRTQVERDLIAYIKLLHDTFQITHNDLFQRNVMVDNTGKFYIIDFGKAKYQEIGEDHEQFRKSDIAVLVSEVRKFFQEIDKIDINAII